MSVKELFRLVWNNMILNRFKVLLTSIGIVIGAATIVLVIAVGRGGQEDVAEQFKNLNAGAIDITSGSQTATDLASEISDVMSNGGMPTMQGGGFERGDSNGSSGMGKKFHPLKP